MCIRDSLDGTVQIIDVATAQVKRPLNVDAGPYGVKSVSFSPKGDMVAAGCYSGKIFFVDAAAGEIKSSLNVDGEVDSVHWSPCGTKIAAACNDDYTDNYCVKILNSETGALLCALMAHSKDNEECTCKHDAGRYRLDYEANPDCPVVYGDFTSF